MTEPFTSFLNWELSVWPHLSQATPIHTWKVYGYVYTCCSWLGMLPGTWAYVSAGGTKRAFIKQASEAIFPGGPEQYWTVEIGLVATVVAASCVSRLAKDAIKEIE